jgi:hypothetical protein
MKNFLILFLFLFFCLVSVNAQENKKFINITGTSEVIVPADQMNFTVTIRTIADSIEVSKRISDKRVDEVLELLKKEGINSQDIETVPVYFGKYYETKDRERIQKGFNTDIRVTFLLKDLSKYYELTNKLCSSSSFETVNSVYGISDYELQNKAAYQKALKAAKEKAEYMANTLGLKLGDVLEIDEYSGGQSYPNSTSLQSGVVFQNDSIAGKVNIKRSIRVKFAIE